MIPKSGHRFSERSCSNLLDYDPEKWAPVFGKDHAPTKIASGDHRPHESRPARARRLGANAWRPAPGYTVSTVSRVLRLAVGSAAGGAAAAGAVKARRARRLSHISRPPRIASESANGVR